MYRKSLILLDIQKSPGCIVQFLVITGDRSAFQAVPYHGTNLCNLRFEKLLSFVSFGRFDKPSIWPQKSIKNGGYKQFEIIREYLKFIHNIHQKNAENLLVVF